PFRGRHVPLVTHAEFEGEAVAQRDLVLDEEPHRTLIDDASPLTERRAESIRRSSQECFDARKVEDAGTLGKVLVDEMPVLAAQGDRMAASRMPESIDQDIRRINAALGEVAGSAKVEIA